MKKADKQIKVADLYFVDFALKPGPVRKEKHIEPTWCYFFLTDEPCARFSRGFPSFHNNDGPLFGDPIRKLFHMTSAK